MTCSTATISQPLTHSTLALSNTTLLFTTTGKESLLRENGGECTFGHSWAVRFRKRHNLPTKDQNTRKRKRALNGAEDGGEWMAGVFDVWVCSVLCGDGELLMTYHIPCRFIFSLFYHSLTFPSLYFSFIQPPLAPSLPPPPVALPPPPRPLHQAVRPPPRPLPEPPAPPPAATLRRSTTRTTTARTTRASSSCASKSLWGVVCVAGEMKEVWGVMDGAWFWMG